MVMELMLALFNIVQDTISAIMTAAGFGAAQKTTLPKEMIKTIKKCGFFESILAGEPSQNVGRSFIKSYCAVCLEGAVIVLACIIFSLFAASPPVVNPDAVAVTQVWAYIGELLFNMLVLVGSVKMSDRIIREMMGL